MTDGLLCVAGGFPTTRDAEHAYAEVVDLLDPPAFLATSFEAPHEPVVVVGSARAQALPEQARLFVFPGHAQLTGTVRVADLLASTGIDEVRGLGGHEVGEDEEIFTQDFVRPCLYAGRVVLEVRPYGGEASPARLIPFEQPNPTPCCADH